MAEPEPVDASAPETVANDDPATDGNGDDAGVAVGSLVAPDSLIDMERSSSFAAATAAAESAAALDDPEGDALAVEEAAFDAPEMCEIYLSAVHLKNLDTFSHSDPICYLSIKESSNGRWQEVGRTEEVRNNLNPVWITTFTIPYQLAAHLRFKVYDIDKRAGGLHDQDFIGEMELPLGKVIHEASSKLTRRLTVEIEPDKSRGELTVIVRPLEEQTRTASEYRQILIRLATTITEVAQKGKTKKKTFAFGKDGIVSGIFVLNWFMKEVMHTVNDRDAAVSEIQFLVHTGHILPVEGGKRIRTADGVFSTTGRYMVNKYCVLGFDHPKAKTVLLPVVEADFKLPTEDADDARALFVDQVDGTYFLPKHWRDAPDIRFGDPESPGQTPPVVAASLFMLIERITYDIHPDMRLLSAVLLLHKEFATSLEFFEKLTSRFVIEDDAVDEHRQAVVRLRVLNVLKMWAQRHYDDFAHNPELEEHAIAFLNSVLETSTPGLQRLAKLIMTTLAERREAFIMAEGAAEDRAAGMFVGDGPTTSATLPSLIDHPLSSFRLLDLHPTEAARQICILECDLYSSINIRECMGLAWSKAGKEEKAPNMLRLIDHFNKMSNYVRDQILSRDTVEARVEVMVFFTNVCVKLYELQNYNGAMEVLSGMSASSVHRLKLTWEAFRSKRRLHALYEDVHEAMSHTKNFQNYRRNLLNASPPCVPYLGLFLTDLTFAEEGNPDETADGLINITKFMQISDILNKIQRFQVRGYVRLEPVREIQDFFLAQMANPMDEEDCYSLSLRIEPRSRPPPDLNVLAEENATLKQEVKDLKYTVSRLDRTVKLLLDANDRLESLFLDYARKTTARDMEAHGGALDASMPAEMFAEVEPDDHDDDMETSTAGDDDDDGEPGPSGSSGPTDEEPSTTSTADASSPTAAAASSPTAAAIPATTTTPKPKPPTIDTAVGSATTTSTSGGGRGVTSATPSPRMPVTPSAEAPEPRRPGEIIASSNNSKRRSASMSLSKNGSLRARGASFTRITPPAANSFESPIRAGWIEKKGGSGFRVWQKRYCVLEGDFLYYFRSLTDTEPAGSVPVSVATLSLTTKNGFDLAIPDRTYHFRTDGYENQMGWYNVLAGIANT